jgi:hypothetical protein
MTAKVGVLPLVVLTFAGSVGAQPPPAPLPIPAPPTARAPTYLGPSDRPDPRPIAEPTPADLRVLAVQGPAPPGEAAPVTPAPAPAPAPVLTLAVPHTDHPALTMLFHIHRPRLFAPKKPTPAAGPPATYGAAPPLPSPQSPGKGRFFP